MDAIPDRHQDYTSRRHNFRLDKTETFIPSDQYGARDLQLYGHPYSGRYRQDHVTHTRPVNGGVSHINPQVYQRRGTKDKSQHRQAHRTNKRQRGAEIKADSRTSCATSSAVSRLKENTETIYFPELWSTHMTQKDYAQLHQWEMESGSQRAETISIKGSQSHGAVSRKRPAPPIDVSISMEPPSKQTRIFVNRNHSEFAHLFTNKSQ